MLPKGDNSWWFSEAALKFKRKLRNHVTFSDVACEIELNVECDSTSPGGTYSPWLWQDLLNGLHFFWVPCSLDLQVCPRVSYYLLCYVGHICGLQCYDHLGRICAVLTVQKRQIISQWSRVLEKLTFTHLVKKFPVLMENEHSFLIEKCLPLKANVTLYPTFIFIYIYIYIYIYICYRPSILQVQMLLL